MVEDSPVEKSFATVTKDQDPDAFVTWDLIEITLGAKNVLLIRDRWMLGQPKFHAMESQESGKAVTPVLRPV